MITSGRAQALLATATAFLNGLGIPDVASVKMPDLKVPGALVPSHTWCRKPHQGVLRTFGLKYRGHIHPTCRVRESDGTLGPIRVYPFYVSMRFHPLGGHRAHAEDGGVVPISEDRDYRAFKNARKRARRVARA
jgi:hypothetical protein